MPRFVILEHDHPTLHWDLMLEHDGALKTWRLPRPPGPKQDAAQGAVALPDHRLMYLEYEGPVSGNRGQVKRWDAGTYELVRDDERRWKVRLAGERWRGVLDLPRQKNA
jgi:hypothetical protein